MKIKRCIVCKKPVLSNSLGKQEQKWICSSCNSKFESSTLTSPAGGELCKKCKNRNNDRCRFSALERRKISACSDWIGKNTEHNQKRWRKFEQD